MFIKKEFPNTIIFSGGPNIDYDVDSKIKILKEKNYLDYYIIDAGEIPFNDLITWILKDKKDQMPNNLICLNHKQELVESSKNPLSKKSFNIVSPYLGGHLDEFLEQNMVPLLETNRGCPFSCTFCAWGISSHNIVSKLDIDNTLQEIQYISERSKSRHWMICDANFGLLKRDVEIAKAIRKVKEKCGNPQNISMFLSKNTTKRNLEIAEILGKMISPVIAIQSMDKNVLKNIKRDNISSETYFEIQKKYQDLGAKTFSDMIVPLPEETFKTHLDGLRKLFSMGVGAIENHNMRMLPGAEMNSKETREKFGMKTKYRLIHGDSGIYTNPSGKKIFSFEMEESLRETNTMSEKQVFQLREIHFLIEMFCNYEVYAELFKITRNYGINQLDVMLLFIEQSKKDKELKKFWKSFNFSSKTEWFDTKKEAEYFFSKKENFDKLINQNYEKLNVQYTIIVLKKYKSSFDKILLQVMQSFDVLSKNILIEITKIVFAQFPQLGSNKIEFSSNIDYKKIIDNKTNKKPPKFNSTSFKYSFHNTSLQKEITNVLLRKNTAISKMINTQGYKIHDLKRSIIQKAL